VRLCSNMTLRTILRKAYLEPKEIALITEQSVSSVRKQLVLIQKELESRNIVPLAKLRIPTSIVIEKYYIDLDYLEKSGALDVEIALESAGA